MRPARVLIAVAAVACFGTAAVLATRTPDHVPWYGGDCGTVAGWASNQDPSCNRPLTTYAAWTVALIALGVLCVAGLVLARVSGRVGAATAVVSDAMYAIPLVIAMIWVRAVTDETAVPRGPLALTALVLPAAGLLAIAARTDRARALLTTGAVVGLACAGSLSAYAVMLWGGNGT